MEGDVFVAAASRLGRRKKELTLMKFDRFTALHDGGEYSLFVVHVVALFDLDAVHFYRAARLGGHYYLICHHLACTRDILEGEKGDQGLLYILDSPKNAKIALRLDMEERPSGPRINNLLNRRGEGRSAPAKA